MKMEKRVKKLRELDKERQAIIANLNSPEAKEDSFYRDSLQKDLEANRDEIGYWRECN